MVRDEYGRERALKKIKQISLDELRAKAQVIEHNRKIASMSSEQLRAQAEHDRQQQHQSQGNKGYYGHAQIHWKPIPVKKQEREMSDAEIATWRSRAESARAETPSGLVLSGKTAEIQSIVVNGEDGKIDWRQTAIKREQAAANHRMGSKSSRNLTTAAAQVGSRLCCRPDDPYYRLGDRESG